MSQNYVVVTDDEYFYTGINILIKSKNKKDKVYREKKETIQWMLIDLFVIPCVFIVYFRTVSSNFIFLSQLNVMHNSIIVFSKDKKVSSICDAYGVNCHNINSIAEVDAIIKFPSMHKGIDKVLLTKKEKYVLSSLLRGCSMRELAFREGLSYKTISAHKRNGLIKLGVKNIKLLINDASKEMLTSLFSV